MNTTRKLRELFGDLYYTPRERRRLARAGGRRFATSVPAKRPGRGTLAGLLDVLLFSCPGLRRRELAVRVLALQHLRVQVPARHTDDARRVLGFEAGVPAGVRVDLYADDSPLRIPLGWHPPAERAPALLPWETTPTFELVDARMSSVRLINRRLVRPVVATLDPPWAGSLAAALPTIDLERRTYASELLGWRDAVFATREDHESGRLLDAMRVGEGVVVFFASLVALADR